MKNFTIKKKIYYHDTDCGNVVYYSNYLKYFEEVRTEHLLSKGIDLKECLKKGFFFVVVSVDIKYKNPARYGDDLSISSRIENVKPASIEFSHEIEKQENVLVYCKTRLVSVDMNFKPIPIPQNHRHMPISLCLSQ